MTSAHLLTQEMLIGKDARLYKLGVRAIPDTVITTSTCGNALFRLACQCVRLNLFSWNLTPAFLTSHGFIHADTQPRATVSYLGRTVLEYVR